MVCDPEARDRLRNSAELDVKLAVPEAPEALVITKPAGAEICTEPSCCGEASFLIVNVKEVLAPAAGLVGETATAKKHLLYEEQVDVCPATAGAASIATPSMLAASARKETRATMNPAFSMATLHLYQPRSTSTPIGHHRARDPLCIRTYPLGKWIVLLFLRSV
jgi:hypothetical protein